jgi:molybdate transport system regulatory protein
MPKRREKSGRVLTLRAQVWVEVNGRRAITGKGADLLEQIDIHGSLSEATRQLSISYRAAWMLLNVMNKSWPGPLVRTSTGGHRGGGMKLSKLGLHVLRTYRDSQAQLEHLLETVGEAELIAVLPPPQKRRPARSYRGR